MTCVKNESVTHIQYMIYFTDIFKNINNNTSKLPSVKYMTFVSFRVFYDLGKKFHTLVHTKYNLFYQG